MKGDKFSAYILILITLGLALIAYVIGKFIN